MISAATGVLGVIGHPVRHSASPAMHNAALESTGLDYAYVAFDVPPGRIDEVAPAVRALGIAGLNVTVPHKRAIMSGLDNISDEAAAIGAVNTIANESDALTGYNTDAHGVMASLKRDGGLNTLPAHAVLLGAGGAARAIAYALVNRPEVERISLLNRTIGNAEELASAMDPGGTKVVVGELGESPDRIGEAGLLINATSMGMEPDHERSPVGDATCLHDALVVLDIVYKPLKTKLLQQAESAGARCLDGLGMLVHQGAKSFEIWTGEVAPVDVMRRALVT